MYQLPPLETLCPEYRFMTGGEVWVHKLVGEKSDVASCEEVAIWTPNLLPRRGTGAAAQRGRGRHLWAKGLPSRHERQPRTVDFNRAELARRGASEIRARLLEAGLRVDGDGESIVTRVLKAAKPSDCITVVSRPRWHRLLDPVFVTPAGESAGSAAKPAFGASNGELQALGRLHIAMATCGSKPFGRCCSTGSPNFRDRAGADLFSALVPSLVRAQYPEHLDH
jgi:hypothetical protein